MRKLCPSGYVARINRRQNTGHIPGKSPTNTRIYGKCLNNRVYTVSVCSPVSSEISDLCKLSDLLFFVSYFGSQSKGIQFGDTFFDVCCVN